MSTITKQWLQQTIAEMEEHRDLFPGDLDDNHENVLAALRIALASLEAWAVAWIIEGGKGDTPCHLSSRKEYAEAYPDRKVTPLYTAPPESVSVPDEVSWEDVPEEITEDDMALASAWAHGFNQCRDAMLQGAENSESRCTIQTAPILDSLPKNAESRCSNSPVIPDGWVACSERMPEQFKGILAFNEYGEVWSGAYDRCWNFYCDNLLVEHVTHWMPLPPPPQQE